MDKVTDIYNKLTINIPDSTLISYTLSSILIALGIAIMLFIGIYVLILFTSDLMFRRELRLFKREYKLNKNYKEKNSYLFLSNSLANVLLLLVQIIYIIELFRGSIPIPIVVIHIILMINLIRGNERRNCFAYCVTYFKLVRSTKDLDKLVGTRELDNFRKSLMLINIESDVRKDFYLFNLYLEANLNRYIELSKTLGYRIDDKLVEDINLILTLPPKIFVSENVSDTDVYKLLKFYKTTLFIDIKNTFKVYNSLYKKANKPLYTTLKDSLENIVELSKKSELLTKDYTGKLGNDYVVRKL